MVERNCDVTEGYEDHWAVTLDYCQIELEQR